MTKSVCTGTRAIVKALPSGSISEDVWEVVVGQRARRPGEENVRPVVMRASKEEFGVCREMLRFIGVKLRQVRERPHRLHKTEVVTGVIEAFHTSRTQMWIQDGN